MTTLERLQARFNVDNELTHRPARGHFNAPYFGSVGQFGSLPNPLTMTGFELAESILIAQKHVVQVQAAIANMQRILDTAEPMPAKEVTDA